MTAEELFSVRIKKPDEAVRRAAGKKWDAVAKPIDGLGDLEEIICRIAAIRGTVSPDISTKSLIIMCADNGVVAHGVSQADARVTEDIAALMGQHRSAVCVMTKDYPLEILTVDVGMACDRSPEGVIDRKVRKGTADLLSGPAMTEEECLAAVKTGMDLVRDCASGGTGLIATGEMGIGNTTTSTALLCALTGISPQEVTGRGAGLSDEGLRRKLVVIEEALSLHSCMNPEDVNALELLRRVGGLDIAGLSGVFIGGAVCGIPVVIDGVISAVAALCAERMVPGCRDFMIASHNGKERGTGEALRRLSLKPVIHANLALGEGTGAVLLFPLLDMAMSLYESGTGFGETDVRQYVRFDR